MNGKNKGYESSGKRTETPVVACGLNDLVQLLGPVKYNALVESIRRDEINEGVGANYDFINRDYKGGGAAA
jgi:hypothetical protein